MSKYIIPELSDLLDDVCQAWQVSADGVISKSRKRSVTWPRHVFCYVAFFYTRHSVKTIGQFLGGRDHSTTLHSRNVIDDMLDSNDEDFTAKWEHFKQTSKYFAKLKIIRRPYKCAKK